MNKKAKSYVSLLKLQKKLTISLIALVAVFASIGITYLCAYQSAESKYESTIADLKKQLNDRVATYDDVSTEAVLSLIDSELKTIGELATIEYFYTNAGKFSDPKEFFGHDIPLSITTKSFIAKWDGTIKAGINIEQVSTDVNNLKKEIIVHLPPPEILSHEVDPDSFETLDEKDGLFNPIRVDDSKKFEAACNDAMEARAVECGLLEKATKNAEELLTKLLEASPAIKRNYSITFQTNSK